MLEKRSALELAISILDFGEDDNVSDSVAPAVYVGQFARLIEQQDSVSMHPYVSESGFPELTFFIVTWN